MLMYTTRHRNRETQLNAVTVSLVITKMATKESLINEVSDSEKLLIVL